MGFKLMYQPEFFELLNECPSPTVNSLMKLNYQEPEQHNWVRKSSAEGAGVGGLWVRVSQKIRSLSDVSDDKK